MNNATEALQTPGVALPLPHLVIPVLGVCCLPRTTPVECRVTVTCYIPTLARRLPLLPEILTLLPHPRLPFTTVEVAVRNATLVQGWLHRRSQNSKLYSFALCARACRRTRSCYPVAQQGQGHVLTPRGGGSNLNVDMYIQRGIRCFRHRHERPGRGGGEGWRLCRWPIWISPEARTLS